jgi:hypothetical protein
MATAIRLMPTDRPSSTLRSRLAAILDRANPEWYGVGYTPCYCTRCRVIRRLPLDCQWCGYHGPPVVTPCDCVEGRRANLAFVEKEIAAIKAGRPIASGDYSLASLEAIRAETIAMPNQMCHAYTEQALRLAQHKYCAHGAISCPTCGGDDNSGPSIDARSLMPVLRELRMILNVR